MKAASIDNLVIKQYLLGDLEASKKRQLEELLVTDDGFIQELVMVEDDLVDDYVDQRLSASEQVSFEKHFLAAPERQDKLRFAYSLRRYVDAASLPVPGTKDQTLVRHSFWQSMMAFIRGNTLTTAAWALVLVLAAICGLLLVREQRLRTEIANLRAQQPTSEAELAELRNQSKELAEVLQRAERERDQLQEELTRAKSLKPTVDRPTLASITTPMLMMGATRGAGAMQEINVPPKTSFVNVPLAIPKRSYVSYRALLIDDQGRTPYSNAKLKSGNTGEHMTVTVGLPARVLVPGEYQIKLIGETAEHQVEPIGTYTFRVLTR